MTGRRGIGRLEARLTHDWGVALIGVCAFFAPLFYPSWFMMLPSGRLLVWPFFAVSVAMVCLWLIVWLHALRRKPVPLPLVLSSFVLTVFHLFGFAPMWGCVIGTCYW